MAPEHTSDAEWPDPPTNANEFYADLQRFHEQRGTSLDITPKVNGKQIDLHRLFQVVQARNGYDEVSREKLLWRKIGAEFNLGQTNAAAYAFALKSTFYKYLAAYAIKRVYKQNPPPKEILEQTTAKGGDLLTRTVENYHTRGGRESLVNGRESEASDDDARRTPRPDRDGEDPGSGTRTRGLRQAPPQRVIYQPDVSSTRQPRQSSMQAQSNPGAPPHAMNHHAAMAHASSAASPGEAHQLRNQASIALRPVSTPASNPIQFREKARRTLEDQRAKLGIPPPTRPTMLPGTGFDGPNIYVRTLLALRSGVPQEQDYALHHLVKISMERGDKYKFEAFPGLADGLIEKVLEVSGLFYDVKWKISYDEDEQSRDKQVLDGLQGTPDILERIRSLDKIDVSDGLQPQDFAHKLLKCNEACLVIRNMSMLPENAKSLADYRPLRDLLSIVLNLPDVDMLVEMKHYALDIAEQVTTHWSLTAADPLYISLLSVLGQSADRGACLSALRAVCRSSMSLNESKRSYPTNVPADTLKKLFEWVSLGDDDLEERTLDFLYQYTMLPENVSALLSAASTDTISLPNLVEQLCQNFMHGTHEITYKQIVRAAVPEPEPKEVPDLPREYFDQIMPLAEPERSQIWLRSCFTEDAASEVTQLALWQAYQGRFTAYQPPHAPLLVAAEFIRNVSVTFKGATAHVVPDPANPATRQRYIIKGIRPRRVPVDRHDRPLLRCLWTAYRPCGAYRAGPAALYEHVLAHHVGVPRAADGKWDATAARNQAETQQHRFVCAWARCRHFLATRGTTDPAAVALHVKTHLPDADPATAAQHARSHKRRKLELPPDLATMRARGGAPAPPPREEFDAAGEDGGGQDPLVRTAMYRDSRVDKDTREPIGLALTSTLVLRNLARGIPRALATPEAGVGGEGGAAAAAAGDSPSEEARAWIERLFAPQVGRVQAALAHNRTLAGNFYDLLEHIERGLKEEEEEEE